MNRPVVTLSTDFGSGSAYVAELKGVLLSALPDVTIVDINHDIPPYSLRHAELGLRRTAFAFPLGTVHLLIVDPGVGTGTRRPIAVQARGMSFVGPDNGILALPLAQPDARCVVLDKPEFWRPLSSTFHGRDLFATVAAELAGGLTLDDVGSPIAIADTHPSHLPTLRKDQQVFQGETLLADRFGNLTTNISKSVAQTIQNITVDGRSVRLVDTYGAAPRGELVAMWGSDGYLEIAMREASAARYLGCESGVVVTGEKE